MVDNPIRGVSGPGKFSVRTDLPASQLFAPTSRPDEPITSGVAAGPGPGPEVMGYNGQSEKLSDILSQMLPYDTDGEIAILYQQAVSRGL
jgi:hypothetical protein